MDEMMFYVKGVFYSFFGKMEKDPDYWKLSGRACRGEFWWTYLFLRLIGLAAPLLFHPFYGTENEIVKGVGLGILVVIIIFISIIFLRIGIRRCHDCNYPVWLYIIAWVIRYMVLISLGILVSKFIYSIISVIFVGLESGFLGKEIDETLEETVLIFYICVLVGVVKMIMDIILLIPLVKKTVQESNKYGLPADKYYEKYLEDNRNNVENKGIE